MTPSVPLVMRVLLHCPYCEELEEYALVVTMNCVGRLWGTAGSFGRTRDTGIHGLDCGYSPSDWAPTRVAALAEWKEAEWKTHVIAQQGVRSPT